jgi:hypothetical protein
MRIGSVVLASGLFVLAGCSGGTFNWVNPTQGIGGYGGARLSGSVHGGQQPIVGAQVYLFAANTTGYGGAGIAASNSNASVSLLTSAGNTTLDASGGATNGDYYVTTDGSGSFSITGDYTCTSGSQVYLYAVGGNPGAGLNSAAGLMAVLGNCPMAGNFAAATPFVMVNEVSTIAAAYAFAGFATDATHVSSSGTALALTGIANAFANAANLASLSTGTALATTPAGNGAVPQAEINTLANLLAACVNSTGAASNPCSTLFSSTLTAGATGAQPSDTATAAINIAHNPGSNVVALYALVLGTPPFSPGLTVAPSDWTLAVVFSGGTLLGSASIAIDGAGDVWLPNSVPGANSVTELAPSGAFLSGASGYSGGGMTTPWYLALDTSGNAWVTGASNNVVEISPTGAILSGSSGFSGLNTLGNNSINYPTGIAIDGSGDVWVPSTNVNSGVSVFTNTGGFAEWINGSVMGMNGVLGIAIDSSGQAYVANNAENSVSMFTGPPTGPSPQLSGGGLASPAHIAVDGFGSVWITNFGNNALAKFSKTGIAISESGGITGGLSGPEGIAIDGASNVWIANATNKRLVEFSNSGSVLSGSTGYRSGDQLTLLWIAIDGSGNVWETSSGSSIYQIVGAAAPVVTPLAAGVKNNMLGMRP